MTRQFVLRPLEESDTLALAKTLNNENVVKNLREGLPFPYTTAHAKTFIADCKRKGDFNQLVRAISVKGELVGCISVARRDTTSRRAAEIGYYINENYWGQGIATGAVKQMCEIAFKSFDIVRIYAELYTHNAASRRVLEKAGFKHEGTLRKSFYKDGEIYDSWLYALLRGE